MELLHKKIKLNTLVLKLLSVIIGFFIWSLINKFHVTTLYYSVPLYFYNIPEKTIINAPDTITVGLRATKKSLYELNHTLLAAHIDLQQLKIGDNIIALTKGALFLPTHIELVHTQPAPIVISLTTA